MFKFSFVLVVFLLELLFQGPGPAFAVEVTRVAFQKNKHSFKKWYGLTDPRDLLARFDRSFYSPEYTDAQQILFLGEDFINDSPDQYSLAEAIKSEFRGESIFKTSLSCPTELNNTQEGKIHSMKLDHTQPLPFNDNQFNTVVMRMGLCYCRCLCEILPGKVGSSSSGCCRGASRLSCGGLKLPRDCELGEVASAIPFFSEVIRVLNKNDMNAVAVVSGTFHSVVNEEEHHGLNIHQEYEKIKDIKSVLEGFESQNPNLRFELVFTEYPLGEILVTRGFNANDPTAVIEEFIYTLKNADGNPLFEPGTFVFDEDYKSGPLSTTSVPIFKGVRISVKNLGTHCSYCSTESSVPLKVCSLCRKAYYCSKPCQENHWKTHKHSCKNSGKDH